GDLPGVSPSFSGPLPAGSGSLRGGRHHGRAAALWNHFPFSEPFSGTSSAPLPARPRLVLPRAPSCPGASPASTGRSALGENTERREEVPPGASGTPLSSGGGNRYPPRREPPRSHG